MIFVIICAVSILIIWPILTKLFRIAAGIDQEGSEFSGFPLPAIIHFALFAVSLCLGAVIVALAAAIM